MTFTVAFRSVARDIMTALGESASYTPAAGGGPIATLALVEQALSVMPTEFNFNATVSETLVQISVLIEDVGVPARDDSILVDGTTYLVQSVLSNDGIVCKVSADA